MSNILVPIIPGNLTPNYCFISWQKTLVDFSAAQQGQLSSGAFFMNVGDTLPGPDFQTFPWLYTVDGRIYRFDGQWITPHELQLPNDAGVRWDFEGSEADLALVGGGDASATHSDRSGPMWEIDHNYDGRSSMGPGLIPGSDPAKTLAVSEAYGSGLVDPASLVVLLNHVHVFGRMEANYVNDDFNFVTGSIENSSLSGPNVLGASTTNNSNPAVSLSTFNGPYLNTGPMADSTGTNPTVLKISLSPPVRGAYKIMRTNRIYRVATGVP